MNNIKLLTYFMKWYDLPSDQTILFEISEIDNIKNFLKLNNKTNETELLIDFMIWNSIDDETNTRIERKVVEKFLKELIRIRKLEKILQK